MAFGLLNNRVTGITASSVSAFGYVVTVYRQGAVVNGNQSSLTGTQKVNIVDTGAIRPGDTVKKAAAGTGYTVMSVVESGSDKYIEIAFGGDTVSFSDGDHIVPTNDLPVLFLSQTGGPATDNAYTIPDANDGVFVLYVQDDGLKYDVFATKSATTTYTSYATSPEVPEAPFGGNTQDRIVFGPTTTMTVTDHVATAPTSTCARLVTNDGAAGELWTIPAGIENQLLILEADDNASLVSVINGNGNILSGLDFTFDHDGDRMVLIAKGSVWYVLARSHSVA